MGHLKVVLRAHCCGPLVTFIIFGLKKLTQAEIIWFISWYDNPGSSSHPELAAPPLPSAPAPQTNKVPEPSPPPGVTKSLPPFNTAPPPLTDQGHAPAIPPTAPQEKAPIPKAPISVPVASTPPPLTIQGHVPALPPPTPPEKAPVTKAPISVPLASAPPPLTIQGHVPALPPTSPQRKEPATGAPISLPVAPGRWSSWISGLHSPLRFLISSEFFLAENVFWMAAFIVLWFMVPVPVATPSRNMPQVSPAVHPSTPETSPRGAHQRNSTDNKGPTSDPTTAGTWWVVFLFAVLDLQ